MRKLILLLALALPAFGGISATMQWDVRTTGSDSNSGGFDPGVSVPGTDYSQQNSPQITYTDLVVGATTSTYTSVLNVVSSALPGNTLVITGGTGCTTGTFEILSNATITATVDRSLGTAASVCTAVLGGSFLTIAHANASPPQATGGNTIWIKSGTYVVTSVITNSQNGETYEGYAATHGDFGTPPLITTSTASTSIFSLGEGNSSDRLINLRMSFTGAASGSIVANGSNQRTVIYGCIFDLTAVAAGYAVNNFDGRTDISELVMNSRFLLNSTAYGVNDSGGNNAPVVVLNNYFTGGAAGVYDSNFSNSQRWIIQGNVFNGNGRGVYAQARGLLSLILIGNDFYGQTNENVYDPPSSSPAAAIIENNIFWGGTYGVSFGGGVPAMAFSQSNAYGNQSTAPYTNWVAGINSSDVTLTANPFTNTATPNFALNSTVGGGAALKAAGFPGVTPFGTGYLDIGALQSQAAAGGSPPAPRPYLQ
jgi:hypothetical protein